MANSDTRDDQAGNGSSDQETSSATCKVCGSASCRCINCQCTDEYHCSMATTVIQSLGSSVVDPSQRDVGSLEEAEFSIEGMSCIACANTIDKAIFQDFESASHTNVIQSVKINVGTDSARVVWRKEGTKQALDRKAVIQRIQDAIEAVGFDVSHVDILTKDIDSTTLQGQLETSNTTTADLQVSGMTCSMCSQSIESTLNDLYGVKEVRVVLATDTVHVSWDSREHTLEEILQNIEDIGYEGELIRMSTKDSRANDIEEGVHPDHNQSTTTEQQTHRPTTTVNDAEAMNQRWQRLSDRQEQKVLQRRNAFLWSFLGTLPILFFTMVLSHFLHRGFLFHHVHIAGHKLQIQALLLWILATPVQFVCGFEFYKMTYFNLKSGRAGMDVLVALGTSAAYSYALVGTLKGDDMSPHFFETSAVLICFVLAGKWLQALAVRRTSEALTRLYQLQSKTAIKVSFSVEKSAFDPLENQYTEAVVPIEEVCKGDVIKVIRGASIPADGTVLYGVMSVDESMVTGESMPVLKTPKSVVLGGTICVECSTSNHERNDTGAAFVEVTGVGSDTALAQIIQLVQDAQTRSVPIQTFADTVSAIFVPTVCLISLLTYMVWYALCSTHVVPESWYEDMGEDPMAFSLMFSLACLVASCPCALGLALPTAVMVGTGVGAKLGVLMKGGEALEVASKVDSIIFDKTGTLTKGKPVITDFVRVDTKDDLDDDFVLWLLGCLERSSEHPLARAVVSYVQGKLSPEYLKEKPLADPSQFRAVTGKGASGFAESMKIAAGNRSFFTSEQQLLIPRSAEFAMQEMEYLGKTAILVAVDDVVTLVLGLADELKPRAKESIAHLRDVMNFDVWMVTGDNSRTARAIADQLGLSPDRVISEALPAAKVEQVSLLQQQDQIVAMIGDGINDSPALAQADVGISVGTAAEIAAEAADLVLVKGDVQDVCTALDLSRAIFHRIQMNLLFSLLYNTLCIPLAAGVFFPLFHTRLPPTVAALAMALSSISVVMSSLSLRLYSAPDITRPRRRQQWSWRFGFSSNRHATSSNDLRERLIASDHLSHSQASLGDFTESTAVVDNTSPRELRTLPRRGRNGRV